ncbi:MAG TPA: ABC transporter substrate-binding protein [Actinomycetota bacterium]|nr:ABC transporter substrate-binding protein [Actinomycetota bacterium]
MRTATKLVVTISAVAFIATGCSGSKGGGSSGDNHLIIGTTSNIDTMNPFVTFQQNSYAAFEYIYPQLVQFAANGTTVVPDFATKWTTSPNGLVWTFDTVPNATWSDGQPLTAKDIDFTFNTILKYGDGPAGSLVGGLANVKSVKATSDDKLVITYSVAAANVLQELQGIPVLPEHVWAQYATGDGKGLRQFPNLPENGQPLVSGGPFELASYTKDSVAIFARNDTFYGPKPHIDGFGLQYFSNDDAMISALRSGQIQAAINVPPTAVKTLKGDSGLTVYDGPGLQFRDFIINSSPHKTQNLELLDPRVRMAMEYAIDRTSIVQTAWLGYAKPGATILPPAAGIWSDPSIKPLPFDIDKANAILDAAGYAKGSGGIRVANGHPMSYTVLFAKDESGAGDTAFQIIQNGFKQIGIQITQRKEDNDAVNTAILGDNNTYNKFDLAMWDWYPCCPVPDFILSVVQCNEFGNWSDTGYCNPAYDKLYKAQGLERNLKKREQIVYQMQKILYDDRPYIVLSNDDTLNAWSTQWDGFVEGPLGLFNNLSKASLTEVHRVS